MYDYLVVGSGLYGAIFAHEAKAHGKSVLVVDKRPNSLVNTFVGLRSIPFLSILACAFTPRDCVF